MTDWQIVRLGDVADVNPKERLSKGTVAPSLSMADVPAWSRAHDEFSYREAGSGSRFVDGDVLVARITPCLENGKTCRVVGLGPGVVGWGSTEFIVVRGIEGITDSLFLYYLLRSDESRKYAIRHMTGSSGRQRVSGESLSDLEFDLPPLPEQRAIAEVLGALDDKIESNRRIACTVDGLLRAEVEAATALDPDARACTFGDLVTRINVGMNPDSLEQAVPYIGLEHMPRGSMILDKWGDSEGLGSGKAQFAENDILFGKLRPYFKKVGVAPIGGICSTDILVLRPTNETPLSVALAIAASDGLIDYASAASTGTRMPRVSWDYLAAFETQAPGPRQMQVLERRLDPLLQLATGLVAQNRTLAAVRDALLPALLSGRIRVPAAAELVEAS